MFKKGRIRVGWIFLYLFLFGSNIDLLAHFFDVVYHYGLLICLVFGIVTLLLLIERILNPNIRLSSLAVIHGGIASLFIVLIFIGFVYWTSWFDNVGLTPSYIDDIILLVYILLVPIISFIIGSLLMIGTVLLGLVLTKALYK